MEGTVVRIDPATSPVQAALLDQYVQALEEDSLALGEFLQSLNSPIIRNSLKNPHGLPPFEPSGSWEL